MKYRITTRNQLIALRFIVLLFVFCLSCIVYFNRKQGAQNHALVFFSTAFIISFLPVLYLHLEYYLFNKETVLTIEPSGNKLIYTNKPGETQTIYFKDIDKIVYYAGQSWQQKSPMRFTMSPFQNYNYALIFPKDNKEIVITSLMIPRIEDAFSVIVGVPIERKKRPFASILIK